ncbi:MAG TPA: NUDIX domain-containing protein [Solirubrobacteraceae bacterium]|nr:NUDIX domain-containing protein [Solirubrobacteraceae bacterium]
MAQGSLGSLLRQARSRANAPVGAPRRTAAALCFRRRERRLQFRLVRSRDGERWTFPNGPQRPEETLAQAAAREAADKAGVSGVVDDRPLTEYRHARRADDLAAAFLLAVQSAAPSAAAGRSPTWFDAATTHEKLAEGRDAAQARELQRVVEIAEDELRDA